MCPSSSKEISVAGARCQEVRNAGGEEATVHSGAWQATQKALQVFEQQRKAIWQAPLKKMALASCTNSGEEKMIGR